jgi:hypothetical protein
LRRYLEYLEAAFLIHRLYRVDHNARRFQRETHFKVYLTNPSIRAALFGAIGPDDEAMGRLVETAFIGQFVHSDTIENLHYARWPNGEVDFVMLDRRTQRPELVLEAKWSDRAIERPHEELKPLLEFCKRSSIGSAEVLTRSRHHVEIVDGVRLTFAPAAIECLNFGLLYIADPLEKGRHPRPAIRLDDSSSRKRR